MVIAWNTGAAAARFRHNLKLKKKKRKKRQAASSKRQASSAIKGTHSNGRILKIERKKC